jgi:GTP-binding protein HflX
MAPAAAFAEGRLHEAVGLAEALDLETIDAKIAPLRRIHPGAYFGEGRIAEIAAAAEAGLAGVVVVDASLSPVQQRNLERALKAKVVDRTGLILEIFARRARTREGRVQVELARLEYERSRLVRTWTHLERQRGGLGKTGGPGETQIELDRRLIAARIDKLKAELSEVRRTRGLQRSARDRAGLPVVALVGYTNAGKSTLFNRLTAAGVLAKDMLFATLDPTARQVRLPSGRLVIVSDTVGFISDLPVELVEAFRATLEEVAAADVIVHVRDIAHADTETQRADVEDVLAQVLSEPAPPMIEAWNKIDLLDPERRLARVRRAEAAHAGDGVAAAISAQTGEGVDRLLDHVDRLAHGPAHTVVLQIDPTDGRTRAQIAAHGRILCERLDDAANRLEITVDLTARDAARFQALAVDRPGV